MVGFTLKTGGATSRARKHAKEASALPPLPPPRSNRRPIPEISDLRERSQALTRGGKTPFDTNLSLALILSQAEPRSHRGAEPRAEEDRGDAGPLAVPPALGRCPVSTLFPLLTLATLRITATVP